MKKKVAVFQRADRLFVHPYCRTTAGVWIFCMPILSVAPTAPTSELGSAVLRSFEECKDQVPHPAPNAFTTLSEPLYKLAGVRSWNQFAKTAKHVTIELEGDYASLIPTENQGKNGFGYLNDCTVSSPPDEKRIGAALLEALRLCKCGN